MEPERLAKMPSRQDVVQHVGSFDENEFQNCIEELGSPDKSAVSDAEERLLSLGPKSIERLLEQLRVENKARSKRYIKRMVFYSVLIGAANIALTEAVSGFPVQGYLWFMIGGSLAASNLTTPTHRAILRTLGSIQDKRAVGPLLDAIEPRDKTSKLLVEEALLRVLPLITDADGYLVNAQQHARLLGLLAHENRELAIAALGALQLVGDQSAVYHIRRCADGHVKLFNKDPYRRQAAVALIAIGERLERTRETAQLLRPAERPEDEESVLLRPAVGPGDTDASTLLRPAEVESSLETIVKTPLDQVVGYNGNSSPR